MRLSSLFTPAAEAVRGLGEFVKEEARPPFCNQWALEQCPQTVLQGSVAARPQPEQLLFDLLHALSFCM